MNRSIAGLLVLLSALGSLGIHAFVPALPAVGRDLAASPGLVQLGIGLYMVGLVAGQLVGGWASDLLGRRRILLAGGLLYVAGALLCMLSGDILLFLGARILQGCGGACALVVARAVVADLSRAEETASELARLALITLLAPTLAPLLGGLLVATGGWRLVFATLAAAGAVALAATWRTLPETAPCGERDGPALAAFPRLLKRWTFLRFTLVNAFGTIGMFGFLAGTSFLLLDLYGFGAFGAGIAFLCVAASVMAGTLASGRIERRRPGRGFAAGTLLFAAGGLAMLGIAGWATHPAGLVAPMMLSGLGAGLIGPAALAGALQAAAPSERGTASSLFGSIQMVFGAATTGAMALFYQPTPFTVAVPLAISGLLVLSAAWAGQKRAA